MLTKGMVALRVSPFLLMRMANRALSRSLRGYLTKYDCSSGM